MHLDKRFRLPSGALSSRIAKPFALASIFDEQSNTIFAPNVGDHFHALHCLGDRHGAHFREVFCVRMPYREACMYSRINAYVRHSSFID